MINDTMSNLKTVRDALELGLLKVKTLKALWDIHHPEDNRADTSFNHIETALTLALDRMIETPAPTEKVDVKNECALEWTYSNHAIQESIKMFPRTWETIRNALKYNKLQSSENEKVDLDVLKREINSLNGRWCKDDGKTTTSDDLIDYLANTGRLR